jgi:hypothetical protein
MGTNSSEITYLALVVGRQFLVDFRLSKPPLSAWRLTFRRLREGGSAASSYLLRLRRPSLRGAGSDCWWSLDALGDAPGGLGSSSALSELAESCWSSSAVLGGPCWPSSAVCV